jgi:superfamily I DNA/RNA helicase
MFELDFTIERNLILDCCSKNIIVYACAGAGKSTTLVGKAYRESKFSNTWKKIAIITFTNKSKNDLVNRIDNESIVISTFHGFIFENIFPFDQEINEDLSEKFNQRADTYLEWLNALHNKNIILGSKGVNDFVLQHAIALCNKKNVLDFIKSKFHAIYIDEAQDNNYQQYELVEIFINCGVRILMVGDPNQTLYSFRGANASKFISYFKDKRFKKYELKRNFRCNSIVDEIANSYDFPNFQKYENGEGYFIVKESQLNNIVNRLEGETIAFLKKANLSLIDYNGKFSILKDLSFSPNISENIKKIVICLLKMKFQNNYYIYNLVDDLKMDIEEMERKSFENFRENINKFIRTDNKKYLNKVLDFIIYDDTNEEVYENYIFLKNLDTTKNFFQNTNKHVTIHSSKGLEFDNVIIKRDDFYYKGSLERNNFYVAMTRARKRVMVIF